MSKSLTTIAISIAVIVGCAAAHHVRYIEDVSGICGDNATWTLVSRTFTLNGNGAVDTFCDISNPLMVDKVVIGDGITSIDFPLFEDWNNVKSVVIGRSLSHIESSAFKGCSIFKEFVDGGNPYFSFINGVLFDKGGKTLIIFPAGKVGRYVFPAGVETIAENAFASCSLTSMLISESVSSIPPGAFRSCFAMLKLEVDENNKYYTAVENVLFNKEKTALIHFSCNGRNTYTVPAGVESVDSFCWCDNLSSVVLPDSVTTIGNFTFHGCYDLHSVNIPASVTSIGFGALSLLGTLKNFDVHEDNQYFSQKDGVLFDKEGKTLLRYACGMGSRYTVPDGVEVIDGYAFTQCYKLESITIPDGVTTIEDGAFAKCVNLENVSISKSVTTIGEQALRDCSDLKSITVDNDNPAFSSIDGALFDKSGETLIRYPCRSNHNYTLPDSVKTIKAGAFSLCYFFSYIKIGESLEEIDPHLFSDASLTTIEVSDKNQRFTSVDGVLYDKDVKTLKLFPGDKDDNFTLPDTVESIGTCFAGSNLRVVTLGAKVSAIEPFAFARCPKLKAVVYLGTEDPGVNTRSVFYQSYELSFICVTPGYNPSTFCGVTVYRDGIAKCYYEPPISSSNLVVPSIVIVLVVSVILEVIF